MARILSKGEHEYLRGDTEIDKDGPRERTVRNRIRDHIKEAIREFRVIQDIVEQRDKDQIHDEIEPTGSTEYLYQNFTDTDEPTLEQGLVAMVSFVYESCQNSELEFETVVERALDEHHENDTAVDLEVNDLSEIDVEAAARKHFLSDKEVTNEELEAMKKQITQKIGQENGLFSEAE